MQEIGIQCLQFKKFKGSWKEGISGITHLPTVTHPHLPNAKRCTESGLRKEFLLGAQRGVGFPNVH